MNIVTDSKYMIPHQSPALERGPAWLREKRRASQTEFNELPLPRRGLHLWRYTDPSGFMAIPDSADETAPSENYKLVEKLELDHLKSGNLEALVTDFGGRDIKVSRSGDDVTKGLVISSLSEAANSHAELIEKHLYSLIGGSSGKFEAMNSALWNDGIFIYVPDNVEVKKPLHLLREAGVEGSIQYPRLLVVVGKNASLTIVDEYGGGSSDFRNGQSYSNAVVEIIAEQDSRLRYISLQRQASGMQSYLTHRAQAQAGASILTIPLVFGAAISKQNFGVLLDGKGADSKMYGLLFGTSRQHLDNHTLHHHRAGMTTSDIDFKVVLRDKAMSAYTGLIRIEEDAKTCEAYQENRNLLLSDSTRAQTVPELEILNEDVSCSHGATAGPIDPMQIFQLQSRGIHEADAVRMIVSGYVQSSLKLVPEDLRERISEFVAHRLEDI